VESLVASATPGRLQDSQQTRPARLIRILLLRR
jgi:hypothetical protein